MIFNDNHTFFPNSINEGKGQKEKQKQRKSDKKPNKS